MGSKFLRLHTAGDIRGQGKKAHTDEHQKAQLAFLDGLPGEMADRAAPDRCLGPGAALPPRHVSPQQPLGQQRRVGQDDHDQQGCSKEGRITVLQRGALHSVRPTQAGVDEDDGQGRHQRGPQRTGNQQRTEDAPGQPFGTG